MGTVINDKTVNEVVTVPVGSQNVDLYAHGDRIVSHIRGGGDFEPQTRKAWAEICGRGGIIIDVGAYTGLYGIAAAKFGATAMLFEPMPFNMQRIQDNRALNRVGVFLNDCAVADVEGEVELFFNPKVTGLTSGATLIKAKDDRTGMRVRSMPIDVMELPRVTAIKIDVERAEAKVLRGARETIKRCRPTIILEVLDAKVEGEIRTEMLELDYRLDNVLDVRNWLLVPA
jgi:FkbM family methyltransferase